MSTKCANKSSSEKILVSLTFDEVYQILYCMEQMASDYTDETTKDYKDWSSALEELQEPWSKR